MSRYKSGLHKEVSAIFGGQSFNMAAANQTNTAVAEPKTAEANSSNTNSGSAQKSDNVSHILNKASNMSAQIVIKKGQENIITNLLGKIRNKIDPNGNNPNAKRQLIMVCTMPLLSVIMVFGLVKSFGTAKKPIKLKTAQNIGISAKDIDLEKAWAIPAEYPSNLRDPMEVASKTGNVDAPGDVVVTGILYSSVKPTAVISGKVAKVGDIIFGVKVIKINPESVDLLKNGKVWRQRVQRK